jgi:ubiquinone/menaquinone biosynthesis C-methylase UbiE
LKNRIVYSNSAKAYDKFIEPTMTKCRKITLDMYPPRNDISILDVCCGTGGQFNMYRQAGCKLFSIDK